jgi:hypothetical protein
MILAYIRDEYELNTFQATAHRKLLGICDLYLELSR